MGNLFYLHKNNYIITHQIDSGGYAGVYAIRYPGTNKRYALKRFFNRYHVRTFLNETNALTALENNPHTPSLVDAGFNDGHLEIITEHVDGDRLDRYTQQHGPLSEKKALSLFNQLLQCLKGAHSKDILHKDIKPSNILLTKESVYLIDWGVSELKGSGRCESIRTNHEYVAPECFHGWQDYSTDLYSLGLLLFEAVSGKSPYQFSKIPSHFYRCLAHCLEPLDLDSITSEKINILVQALTHKDPQKRLVAYSAQDILKGSLPTLPATLPSIPLSPDQNDEKYLLLAADAEIPYAQHTLATQLFSQKKDNMAMSMLTKAAEQGYTKSQYTLAQRLEQGMPSEKDVTKALHFYKKAAEHGNAPAQNKLGTLYRDGIYHDKDLKKAQYWLHQAALKGNSKAQNNLGLLFEKQLNDQAQALAWYQAGAIRGNTRAQNNLGRCLQKGIGTAIDKAKAYYWYNLAAKAGNQRAAELLHTLLKEITTTG